MGRDSISREPQRSDPAEWFRGTVLIVAPHMDDEVLACGGLIARLPDKGKIHVLYATDGMRSPAPVMPWRDAITHDLGEIRKRESKAATALLGVPLENLEFLGLPDYDLRGHMPELKRLVAQSLQRLDPDHVLIPFRYDRHPDHLAIHEAVVSARRGGSVRAVLTEYFVYYRWRLLPKRDVRRYIRSDCLFEVDIDEVASLKRSSLDCFTSQITRFYPWQTRPILTPELLDEECVGPEVFLRDNSSGGGTSVFVGSMLRIRVVHRVEPILHRWKALLKSALLRVLRSDRQASD